MLDVTGVMKSGATGGIEEAQYVTNNVVIKCNVQFINCAMYNSSVCIFCKGNYRKLFWKDILSIVDVRVMGKQ